MSGANQLSASGWAFFQAGNRTAAVRDFRAALAIDPDNFSALVGISQAHLQQNELSQADAVADHMLRVWPNMAQAHRTKGEALVRSHKLVPAERFIRESIKLDPNDTAGYHYLAILQVERGQYAEALKTILEGRKRAPTRAVLAAQQAIVLLYLKGPKAAEPVADEALRLSMDDDYVLLQAARVFVMRRRYQKAHDLLDTVLRRDANNERAISFYLLADPKRYRLMRVHLRFQHWRKTHPASASVAGIVSWVCFAATIISGAGKTVGLLLIPALIVAVVLSVFWQRQYKKHREAVKAHFIKAALKQAY